MQNLQPSSPLINHRSLIAGSIKAQVYKRCAVPEIDRCDILTWTKRHMRTETGEPLDFDSHPYMPAILQDTTRQRGFVCGSQVGKTTMAIATVYWHADTAKEPVRIIYTMHTDMAVRKFSQLRAKPAIKASQYLSQRIGDVDNMHSKLFRRRDGDSAILFSGASEGQQAISEPADMLVHDEVDFSDQGVLRLYQDRVAHGNLDDSQVLLFGTPTVPGFGLSRRWEQSTKYEWLVKCTACSSERPIEWPDSFAVDAATPHYICSRGHTLTWADHIQHGRWVAQHPGADWSMYHIPRSLTPYWPAERIVAAWEDEIFEQHFYNQVMGRPAVSGELTIDEEIMAACISDTELETTGETFLGADPGAVITYVIGRREGDRHVYLRAGEAQSWEELEQLMSVYRVRLAVIDGAYDPTKAGEFARKFNKRVRLAYYTSQPVKGSEPIRESDRLHCLDLDRTQTLDLSANRLIMGIDTFSRFRDEHDRQQFVRQMTACVRAIRVTDDGRRIPYWQETRADHARHAHNYATVAAMIMAGKTGVPMPDSYRAYTQGSEIVEAVNQSTGNLERVEARQVANMEEFLPKDLVTLDSLAEGGGPARDIADVYPAMRAMRGEKPRK